MTDKTSKEEQMDNKETAMDKIRAYQKKQSHIMKPDVWHTIPHHQTFTSMFLDSDEIFRLIFKEKEQALKESRENALKEVIEKIGCYTFITPEKVQEIISEMIGGK